ncbi:MAG: ATP-binding cassette domain-containing protein [Thermodesulfobacteriota bacterium]
MIEFIDVSKTFDSVCALRRMNLTIHRGMTTVLIGPSGCGKSTLLRLIIGLIRADSGTVAFDGARIAQENTLSLRTKMGYVIQEGGLFPHLTAQDNVTLMARYLKWDGGRIRQRIDELAGIVRLPVEDLDRFPAQLSGGQRQRVSLIRALMLDPEVLLLDEPLGSLDPMIRAELQTDLKAIFARLKRTVVLVTHDMGEAAFFGDAIVLIREGRIVQAGTVEALVRSPADPFVTRFINAQRNHLSEPGGERA